MFCQNINHRFPFSSISVILFKCKLDHVLCFPSKLPSNAFCDTYHKPGVRCPIGCGSGLSFKLFLSRLPHFLLFLAGPLSLYILHMAAVISFSKSLLHEDLSLSLCPKQDDSPSTFPTSFLYRQFFLLPVRLHLMYPFLILANKS